MFQVFLAPQSMNIIIPLHHDPLLSLLSVCTSYAHTIRRQLHLCRTALSQRQILISESVLAARFGMFRTFGADHRKASRCISALFLCSCYPRICASDVILLCQLFCLLLTLTMVRTPSSKPVNLFGSGC